MTLLQFKQRVFYLFCRITTTVACNMDLTKYPMDKQTCTLQLESCKHFLQMIKRAKAKYGGRLSVGGLLLDLLDEADEKSFHFT